MFASFSLDCAHYVLHFDFRVLIIFVFIWKQKRQIRSICVFDTIVRIGLIVEYGFNIKILFIVK